MLLSRHKDEVPVRLHVVEAEVGLSAGAGAFDTVVACVELPHRLCAIAQQVTPSCNAIHLQASWNVVAKS